MADVRAVRFDRYGGREVLYITDLPMPVPAAGEVVVAVRAAGINPGEARIRTGELEQRFPTSFPCGQGSDLAGVITAVGDGVTEFGLGDEVLGFSWTRSSHATHTVVPVTQLIRKPAGLDWNRPGGLYVVTCTAYAAVRAVAPETGETVVVSAAAGGVGSVVVQLLAARGVRVIGLASARNDSWLTAHGVQRVGYGDGLAERLTAAAPDGIDAFIDLYGPEYVRLAVDLGIPRDRIETIAARDLGDALGVRTEGSVDASTPEVLTEMAELVASGAVELPIVATYPLDRVADAFAELEQGHTHGKIVLLP